MENGYGILERIIRIGIVLAVVFLILAILVVSVAAQNSKVLTDPRSQGRLVEQILIYALLAGGMSLVLVAGEVDFSAGGMVSLAAAVMAGLVVNLDVPAEVAMVLVLGLGIFVGLANGVLIVLLRLPFYIVTLATWSLAQGLTLVIVTARGYTLSGQFEASLPLLFVLNLLVYGLGVLVLLLLGRFSSLGRLRSLNARTEANGKPGNLPLGLYKIGAYATSGFLAAVVGLALLNLYRMAMPGGYGDLTFLAIAAAVVGGVPLWKGSTRLLGAFLGSMVLVLANQMVAITQGRDQVRLPSILIWAVLTLVALILWGLASWVLDLIFGRRKPDLSSDDTVIMG